MPIKKLIPVNCIIIQALICSSLLTIIALESYGKDYRNIVYTLPIIIPITIFMIIRHRCNVMSTYILLNIATIIFSTFLFKGSFLRFAAVLIMLVLSISSYKMKTSDVSNISETPSIVYAALFVFLAFLGSGMLRAKIYGTIYSCYLLVFFILEYIQMTLCGVSGFISSKQHIKTLPVKKIQRISLLLVVLLCIATILGAIFFGNNLFVNTINNTNTLFIYGFGKILRAIMPDNGNPSGDYYDFTSNKKNDMKIDEDITPNILNIIWNIIGVILLIITVVICVIIIYKAIIYMIKRFAGVHISNNGDETEFILQPVRYSTLTKNAKKTNVLHLKNNDKIRAIYCKTLKKAAGKKYIFNYSQTPEELKHNVIDSYTSPLTGETSIISDQSITQKSAFLTSLYEEARYSNNSLSSDDIKYAKELSESIVSAKR